MNTHKKNLTELANKRNEKEYEWFRTSLITISTVLGLIISLKTKKSATQMEHIMFVSTMILFGICILNGLFFLYGETVTPHKLLNQYLQKLNEGETDISVYSGPGKLFSFLRYTFFGLIILSFTSLIIYVIYADI